MTVARSLIVYADGIIICANENFLETKLAICLYMLMGEVLVHELETFKALCANPTSFPDFISL